MAPMEKCEHCERYATEGHNYCRMCGFCLTKGFVKYVRLAHGYFTNEKFCGYCGDPKHECGC